MIRFVNWCKNEIFFSKIRLAFIFEESNMFCFVYLKFTLEYLDHMKPFMYEIVFENRTLNKTTNAI